MVVADELLLKIRADSTQAQAALLGMDQQIDKTTSRGVSKFKNLGAVIGASVAVAGAAIMGGGAKAFIGFDAAMTQSLAIMGDVSDAMKDDMSKAAREVAKTTTFSAEQAAEAYFFLASAGMDAEQSIGAMPQVAKFAQAGMFDLATATDLATDAQSALGLASDDPTKNLENLTRVTDVFVRANTLANTSVEQIAAAMTNKAGPALRAVGKPIEEGAAVLAAFADQGLKGEAAGTALHIVMRDLQTAALKNKDAFAEAGVAVYDADGEMRNMADIVGDLEGLLGGMTDEQKKATLAQMGFTDKSMGFIQTLLGTSDAIAEYQDELENATGFTDTVAGKQLETFSAQWEILKSKMVDIGLSIGSVLVPKLVSVMEAITPIVDKVVEWVAENPELATQISAIATAVGLLMTALFKGHPVLAAIGAVIWIVKEAMDYFGITLSDVWEFLQPVVGLLADMFAQLGGGSGILEGLKEPLQQFMDVLAEVAEKGAEIYGRIVEWIDEHSEEIMEMVDQVKEFFITAWETIWAVLEPLVTDIFNFINDTVGEFVDWFEEIWPDVQKVFSMVMENINKIWQKIWGIIEDYIMPVWAFIKRIIRGALNVIKGVIQTILAVITGNWSGAWEGIKKILSGAWDIILGVLQGAWTAIQLLFRTIKETLTAIWDTLWMYMGNAVKGAFNGIKSFISGVLNKIISTFEGFANTWIDVLNGLIGAANKIPGINISLIPKLKLGRVSLAEGGMPVGSGGAVRALVGERGPEEVILPGGAQVRPLGANGASGPLIGNLYTQGKDGVEIAQEIGWEMIKRGAGS